MSKTANIFFLIKKAWNIKRIMFPIYIAKLILEAVQPFITIIFSAKILDAISSGLSFSLVSRYVFYMVGLNLLVKVLLSVLLLFHIDLQNKTNNRAGCQLIKEQMSIDYKYNESGDMLSLAQSFFLHVQPAEFLPILGGLLSSVIQVGISAYIALTIHPIILLALLLFVIIKSLLVRSNHRADHQWSLDKVPFIRKFNYLKTAMVSTSYAKEVRINGGQEWIKDKFSNILSSYNLSMSKYFSKKAMPNIIIVIIDALQQILIYLYFSYQVIRGILSIGDLNKMLQVTSLFYKSVNDVFEKLSLLSNTSKHVERYKQYISIVESGNSATGTLSTENIKTGVELEFRNVTMIYPNTTTKVLKNLKFKINAGERIAIVGHNGAGKSTLIKLICRLYEPTEGEILLNGVNINEYNYSEYVDLISVVLQDYKLLAFPIIENIVMNREHVEEKLNYALFVSNLNDKINSLPQGINTTLYRQYDEDGIELSGGESQRVALAREVYKDGKFMILDEPTSALDALTEQKVFETLNEITREKTAIYISHRLSSVIFCDRIITLKDGEVYEIGTHSELIEQKGEYFDMFTKQAENYIAAEGVL